MNNFSYLSKVLDRVAKNPELEIGDQITVVLLSRLFRDNDISTLGELEEIIRID